MAHLTYWCMVSCEYFSRSLIYRWSDEELRLATGNEELTHLQHELKLYSAYLGVPVSF